ncbi:MAG: hypothetical protein HUJ79_05515 [Firmicutes bacterium]|nr:hypothetical protein [Bacillota bacterium]
MSSDNKKRYYRKKTELIKLVEKMKLWPSRSGVLHGVKEVENRGDYAIITTHCGQTFIVRDSRNSRAARWLRNKWVTRPCPKCKIPEWKLDKYSKTFFSDKYGSTLEK